MTLHLGQIFFTEARTFMFLLTFLTAKREAMSRQIFYFKIETSKERLYEETLHLRKILAKVKENNMILTQEVERSE